MSVMLRAALEYAALGYEIFPCRADKKPLTDHGVLDASCDPDDIERWWKEFPDANIGWNVGASGMMALDLDPGHDLEVLRKNLGGIPSTKLKQRTPRGGEHWIYSLNEGELVANDATGKLAPHVDVRSHHGYILLAPSRTADGEYRWLERGEPGKRSDQMVRLANLAKGKSSQRDTWIIEPDLPENVEAAIEWLRGPAKISTEGHGGDNTAYATAAMMISYGISEELAFDLMLQHWNHRCNPPWEPDELDHLRQKVKNAYDFNTSTPGNLTRAYRRAKSSALFQPLAKPDAGMGGAAVLDTPEQHHPPRFRIVDRAGLEAVAPPAWLVADLLPCKASAILFGPSQSFKTFLALDLLLSIAAANAYPWAGTWAGDIVAPGPVLMVVGEGRDNIKKRVRAWEAIHLGGRQVPDFYLMDPVVTVGEDLTDDDGFIRTALEVSEHFAVIALDTVSKAMRGADENKASDAALYDTMARNLTTQFGCTVLGIAHTGHDERDRQRGSYAFEADADVVIQANRPRMDDKITSLQVLKQKDGTRWETPRWWKLADHGEGDNATLVPEATEAPKKPVPKPKGEPSPVAEKMVLEVLDKAVMSVLASNKSRRWKTADLANAVAMREEIGVGSRLLQGRWLRILREDKGTKAHACFDPNAPVAAGQWMYRD